MLEKILTFILLILLGATSSSTFAKDTLSIVVNLNKSDYLDIENKIINIPIFDLKRNDSFFCESSFIDNIDFGKIKSFINIYKKDEMIYKKQIDNLQGISKDNIIEYMEYKPNSKRNKIIHNRLSFSTTIYGNEGLVFFRKIYSTKKSKHISFLQIYYYIINNPHDLVFKINEYGPFWCIHKNKLYVMKINKNRIFLEEYYFYLFQNGLRDFYSNEEVNKRIIKGGDIVLFCKEYKNKSSEIIEINLK